MKPKFMIAVISILLSFSLFVSCSERLSDITGTWYCDSYVSGEKLSGFWKLSLKTDGTFSVEIVVGGEFYLADGSYHQSGDSFSLSTKNQSYSHSYHPISWNDSFYYWLDKEKLYIEYSEGNTLVFTRSQ